MTLTVADIERWDAGSVREVFHAATSQAQAAKDAANGLATLPAFETWGGVAAEAAKDAIGKTRKDLDAHGQEAQTVANAARNAADEIEHIKSELATLKADAEHLGMEIDSVTGQVLPGRSIRDPMEALLKQAQLQPRLDKIVAEANMVDIALANAIHMADGTTSIPGSEAGYDTGSEIPVGKGTEEVKQWWQSLSEEKRRQLLKNWPEKLGHLDGIPVADRGQANAAIAQQDVDRPAEVAASRGVTKEEVLAHPERYGMAGPMMSRYNNGLKAKEALAQTAERTGAPTFLQVYDPEAFGGDGRAAIAIGDPDHADNIAIVVPGTGNSVGGGWLGGKDAVNLYMEAKAADRAHTTAVVAWMGYDAPDSPLDPRIGTTGHTH